jgi:prepilin-type N-terminal cleavage/methylation domain-containing protein
MSYRSSLKRIGQAGFTLVELSVVIVVTSVIAIVIYTIFNSSITNYLGLQKDSYAFDTITKGSQRIANVFRGITDITVAGDKTISFYSYFSPNDQYVSFVRYYVAGSKPSLYAEVTPMTANPPTGVQQTNKKRTYTIIEHFYEKPGVKSFEYLDSTGATLTQPIGDLHVIKGIKINLAISVDPPKNTDVKTNSITVSLRNRKTNL